MGIFSLFGKKDSQQTPLASGQDAARKKREPGSGARDPHNMTVQNGRTIPVVPGPAPRRKVDGKATEMKIDEIESAMSTEFMKYTQAANTRPGPTTIVPADDKPIQPAPISQASPAAPASVSTSARKPAQAPLSKATETPQQHQAPLTTTHAMGKTTQVLLGNETLAGRSALSVSETAPVIEEAAILYANGQYDIALHILQSALHDTSLGDARPMLWNMLFDLYIVVGRKAEFEHLSIEYASVFETSPPTWMDIGVESKPVPSQRSTPAVAFSGRLDQEILKQLDRLKNLAGSHHVLRLEFSRVTEVVPEGCDMLLQTLRKLQASGNDLVLVGAFEFIDKIRAILDVGRRDETDAPWLLLLEVMRLLNLEKEFEEASIDYCITFEVSPPAYVAPRNKVTTAIEDTPAHKEESDVFSMPAVIEGKADLLIASIKQYADAHNPAVFDCLRLKRVDFGAAGQLLTGLAPLSIKGLAIEFRNVNHLVLALFNVIGLTDLIKIVPRKS